MKTKQKTDDDVCSIALSFH